MAIADLLSRIGQTTCDGSSVVQGVCYQNIPGLAIPCCRPNSDLRAERICELINVPGTRVLDLGCSVGTMTSVFQKNGAAKVLGIDHDESSLALAHELHPTVDFEQADISLELLDRLPKFDIAIWTSQFMWMAKQHGLEYALDFLWKLSTKCDTLVFESAGRDDGSAPLDMRQEEFHALLCQNTVYRDIVDHGPWNDGWAPRNVFVCQDPNRTSSSHWSKVSFPSRGIVRKTFRTEELGAHVPFLEELCRREAECLERLAGLKYFPKLISKSSNSIEMSYCGMKAKWIPERDLSGIVRILEMSGITHRDIRPENLLWNGRNTVLVDFSFATIGDEVTNYHYDLGGKYKCPYGFNDEYSLRKVQGELLCRG